MNPPIGTRNTVRTLLPVAAVMILVLGVAGAALAAPVTFNLNYTTTYGEGTAVGTFTVDDSLLVADVETEDLADLLCLNLTVTIPGAPIQVFTKADLTRWYFSTNASAVIRAATFGMDEGRCSTRDYIIQDLDPFEFGIYDCEGPIGPSNALAVFSADPTEGGVCEGAAAVPAVSLPGLAALLLLVGIGAALVLRRGATLG